LVATQMRKASGEQAAAAKQIAQAVESMRRGAASTSRALEEQATAGEQVSKQTQRLARQIAGVSRAMGEQTVAGAQITSGTQSMRQQSDQVAKAMNEQARAARDMTAATQNISKEVGLITRSNRRHLDSSKQVLGTLTDIRRITERNAQGVNATLTGTAGLTERARQLVEIMDSMSAGDASANGGEDRSSKVKARTGNPARTAPKGRNRGGAVSDRQPAVGDQSSAGDGEMAGEDRVE
jgi:methyl-accepting chemotaxis protein